MNPIFLSLPLPQRSIIAVRCCTKKQEVVNSQHYYSSSPFVSTFRVLIKWTVAMILSQSHATDTIGLMVHKPLLHTACTLVILSTVCNLIEYFIVPFDCTKNANFRRAFGIRRLRISNVAKQEHWENTAGFGSAHTA